jgi:D-xylose transport system permease protein
LGVLLIIVCGHIDLAIGSGIGLFGGIAAVLTTLYGWPAPAAMFVSMIAGIATWTCMGTVIVSQRIPAFIITLGGLLVFKGVFWKVINTSTVPVNLGGESNLYSVLTTYYLPSILGYLLAAGVTTVIAIATLKGRASRKRHNFEVEEPETAFYKFMLKAIGLFIAVTVLNMYRGVPLSGVILGATAVGIYVLTQHMAFGRYLYAIGGNEDAAMVSGVPVRRTTIMAFSIAGGLVALTGFLQTSYAGSSTTSVGDLMELDAIAACVIGGVSLKGGRGTVMGVMAGALIMASLLNGLTLISAPPEIKFITRGIVLALAVWMDVRLNRK